MQRVALWWVWDSWGSECAARGFVVVVGQFWRFWVGECSAGGFVVRVGNFVVFGGLSEQRGALWWVWASLGCLCE